MSKIFFILILFVSTYSHAELPEVSGTKVFCDHDYKDGIVVVDKTYRIDDCSGDVLWGFDNTCYVGDGQELVDLINNGDFNWKVGHSMSHAELAEDKETVVYWANTVMASMGGKDLTPCQPDFFESKDILNPEKL